MEGKHGVLISLMPFVNLGIYGGARPRESMVGMNYQGPDYIYVELLALFVYSLAGRLFVMMFMSFV